MDSKLLKILFFLLIVFLPTQLGFHFWPDWAFINGVRVDYLSPTIYFTDLLILGLIVFFKRLPHWSKIFPLLGFALVNIYFSALPQITVYKWFKAFEFLWLLWFLKNGFQLFSWRWVIRLLITGVSFQILLGLLQVVFQRSLGGPLYWLGERLFTVNTPGIAQAVINGQEILRPYGTFSHPNILGGYLVIVGLIILGYTFSVKNTKKFLVMLGVIAFGITITISRASGMALLLGLFLLIFSREPLEKNPKKIWATILVLGIITLGYFILFAGENSGFNNLMTTIFNASFVAREKQIDVALKIIKDNFLLGTGLGTFVAVAQSSAATLYLPSQPLAFLQPVHNIYILLTSEIGLLGWLIIVLVCKNLQIFGWPSKEYFPAVAALVFLGFFDHYLLTSQQGLLLLTLVLGLSHQKLKV